MKIQIKNGNSANLATAGVVLGEPKFCVDTGELYVGNGTANVKIGGGGSGYQPDDTTIGLTDDSKLKVKDSAIGYTQINTSLVSNSLPDMDPSTTKLTTEACVYSAMSSKQDVLTAGTGISIVGGTISVNLSNAETETF